MDELKHKILTLLHKQSPKIPSMGFSDANYHFPQIENLSINSKTVSESDRPADQEILESIEAAYFSIREDYDICRFELEKLPQVLDCDQIQRDFKSLKQQHQVVSKRVLQLILQHQSDCTAEFQDVLQVLEQVTATLLQTQEGRRHLSVAADQCKASLGLLANHRKRRIAQALLDTLSIIKNLHGFEARLQTLLHLEDYPGAILELKRCQRVAARHRHFNCAAALHVRLQEALDANEHHLDRVLAQLCFHFDAARYRRLLHAYRLLDKSEMALMDTLHVHYITAIYNSACNVVAAYVSEDTPSETRNPYKLLCEGVPPQEFIECLGHLCKVLFKIVLSYHQLRRFHQDLEQDASVEASITNQKLEHHLAKIWDDVQRKVSNLLLNADLGAYKFEQVVQVLGLVHRLIQVGEEFAASKSEDLQESIRLQSVSYFQGYHVQRLEELKIFLENEMWEVCPVKVTFDVVQLQEFKPLRMALRNVRRLGAYSAAASTECSASNHSQDGSSGVMGNFFTRYAEHGTPFDVKLDETVIEEDILAGDASGGYFSEDTDEEEEELRRDHVDEYADESVAKPRPSDNDAPTLTNTTLSVLRQMGRYLQMSRLLRPIAYQIVAAMNQLFDYYLFSVHAFFTADLSVASNALYTPELSSALKKIGDNLVGCVGGVTRSPAPLLCPLVDLKAPERLHGLAERITAVESVVFLARQFEGLREYLEFLTPPPNRPMLQQFFTQNIASAQELRKPVYMSVVAQAFDLRQIMVSMTRINWEVKEVMSQHNTYIDLILREVQIFTLRLSEVALKVPVISEVSHALWESAAHIITHTLVQGFSEVRKCSNGGRALMQLDFIQFLSKFEKISALRPVPHREYVENYVKAYYLPEAELEAWIKEHVEYSSKHLFGLVGCACHSNRRARQRLLQAVEEMEKAGR